MSIINNMPQKGGMTLKGQEREYYVYTGATVYAGDFVTKQAGVANNGIYEKIGEGTGSSSYKNSSFRILEVGNNRLLQYYSQTLTLYNFATYSKNATSSVTVDSIAFSSVIDIFLLDETSTGDRRAIILGYSSSSSNGYSVSGQIINISTNGVLSLGTLTPLYSQSSNTYATSSVRACKMSNTKVGILQKRGTSSNGYTYYVSGFSISGDVLSPFQYSVSNNGISSNSQFLKVVDTNYVWVMASSTSMYKIFINSGYSSATNYTINIGTTFSTENTCSIENDEEGNPRALKCTMSYSGYDPVFTFITYIWKDDNIYQVDYWNLTDVASSVSDSSDNLDYCIVPLKDNKYIFIGSSNDGNYNSGWGVFVFYIWFQYGKMRVYYLDKRDYSFMDGCKEMHANVRAWKLNENEIYSEETRRTSSSSSTMTYQWRIYRMPDYELQVMPTTTEETHGVALNSSVGGNEIAHGEKVLIMEPIETETT